MGVENDDNTLNRRDLLQRSSALALGFLGMGAANLHAQELVAAAETPAPVPPPGQTPAAPPKPGTEGGNAKKPTAASNVAPVGIAVIGLGDQGRKHLTSLGYVPGADVRYVCDTYPAIHKRAQDLAPKAAAITDYRKALDDKAVQAIYVATPSHLHREIVLAALQAGKHVYCEAPLASSIEDAKAIATAAKAASPKQIFHAGMQQRTNPQHNHVLGFVRTGALNKIVNARSVWNKKTSWRKPAASPEREQALNWHLRKATSGGLMNEIGIHQVDVTNWFLKSTPISVSGFGSILQWRDGREVPDTVQCLFEYPGNVFLSYSATLANSFDGAYELFQGSDAAIVLRDGRAWMFKEVDAPALGWEVYASKEKIGDETGIMLVADATKLLAEGKKPGEHTDTDPTRGSLYFAGDHFLTAIREKKESVSGAQEGYEANVVALKAHEAVMTGGKINFTKEMFSLG